MNAKTGLPCPVFMDRVKRSLLLCASLALLIHQHEECADTDNHVNNPYKRWPAAKNRFDEIKIEESDQPPVQGADHHQGPGNAMRATAFLHHKKT